jgi:hypothetical protein
MRSKPNLITRVAYDHINQLIDRTYDRQKDIRHGQFVFISFYQRYPVLMRQIAGTKYDPFYDDSKLAAFYDRMESHHIAKSRSPVTAEVQFLTIVLALITFAIGIFVGSLI